MIRALLIGLACLAALPALAQVETLSDAAAKRLQQAAADTALIDTGAVPDILLKASIAATEPRHLDRAPLQSKLTAQLARMHLTGLRTLERKAHEAALATYLSDLLSPREIAEIYAATVYYGRNCYGYRDAVRGLARRTPDRAGDAVWLALAALPRSPTTYLGDRAALKARVSHLIDEMQAAELVDVGEADRLRTLPLANIDTGQGCTGR